MLTGDAAMRGPVGYQPTLSKMPRALIAWAFTKSIAYKLSRDFSFSSFPGA